MPKPRILALHGFRTSAQVFKSQVRRLTGLGDPQARVGESVGPGLRIGIEAWMDSRGCWDPRMRAPMQAGRVRMCMGFLLLWSMQTRHAVACMRLLDARGPCRRDMRGVAWVSYFSGPCRHAMRWCACACSMRVVHADGTCEEVHGFPPCTWSVQTLQAAECMRVLVANGPCMQYMQW
eukprot:357645-Chlamydomonas_euryale.AAC.4